jgi:hypothetical protein
VVIVASPAGSLGALRPVPGSAELVVEAALEELVQSQHADHSDDQADGSQQRQQGDQ